MTMWSSKPRSGFLNTVFHVKEPELLGEMAEASEISLRLNVLIVSESKKVLNGDVTKNRGASLKNPTG